MCLNAIGRRMMPRPQSAPFRRKLTLLVKKTPARARADIRLAVETLIASGIQSMSELVAVVETETSDRNLRGLACWAVGRLRPRGWTATLGRVMATAPDVGLAFTAVERLVEKKSATVVKVLHHVLVRGRSPAGRAEAAWGLGVLHARSAAGSLMRIVLRRTEDCRVRAEAAEALGYLRDRRAVRPLLKLLDDPDPQIRYEAIFSLRNLSDRRALPALDKLLGDTTEVPKYGQLGNAAAEAIQSIEMLNPTRPDKTDIVANPRRSRTLRRSRTRR
jgi:HEAT repeat protein